MTQFDLFAPDPSPHRDPSAAGAPRGGDTVNNRREGEGFYLCGRTICLFTKREVATHWLISENYGVSPVCESCGLAAIANEETGARVYPPFNYRLQAMTPEQFAGRQPWKPPLDDAPGIE